MLQCRRKLTGKPTNKGSSMTLAGFIRTSVVVFVCLQARVSAQVANANMNVVVNDPSGAVVPGASIRVTNNSTGVPRTGAANDRGELQIPFLPAGSYSVSAASPGFKTTTVAAVVLQVDQTAQIKVTLQPGEVHEVIEVKELTTSLETETSSLGQ